MYTAFSKAELAAMLVSAARQPVEYVRQTSAADILDDEEQERLGDAIGGFREYRLDDGAATSAPLTHPHMLIPFSARPLSPLGLHTHLPTCCPHLSSLDDEEQERLGGRVAERSAAAREQLLDANGRPIFSLKTRAARSAERSYFRQRVKSALQSEAMEATGQGHAWGSGPLPAVEMDLTRGRAAELYALFRGAFETQKKCPLCGYKLTAILEHDASLAEFSNGVSTTNVSMDRRMPGAFGGKYEASNIEVMCGGCNYVKQHHTCAAAQKTIEALRARKGQLQLDEAGLLVTPTPGQLHMPTPGERAVLLAWCRRAIARVTTGADRRGLEATLTDQDLLDKLLEVLVGPRTFVDPTGITVDLDDGSLDRLDPSLGYVVENIRIIHVALNTIRRQERTDGPIVHYADQME